VHQFLQKPAAMSTKSPIIAAQVAMSTYDKWLARIQEAAATGDMKKLASTTEDCGKWMLDTLFPALDAAKAAHSDTSNYWAGKVTEYENALVALYGNLGEKPNGSSQDGKSGSSETGQSTSKRKGTPESSDSEVAAEERKRSLRPRKLPLRRVKSDGGATAPDANGNGDARSNIREAAKTIKQQDDKHVRDKEKRIVNHLKDANMLTQPKYLVRAAKKKWPRKAVLYLSYSEVARTGKNGGRLVKGEERRQHPYLKIHSGGPHNKKLELKLLRQAYNALQGNAFGGADGPKEGTILQSSTVEGGKKKTYEIEYAICNRLHDGGDNVSECSDESDGLLLAESGDSSH
jgi:hypothetical protein